MNFFQHQDEAKRKTKQIFILFVVIVVATSVVLGLIVHLAWSTQATSSNISGEFSSIGTFSFGRIAMVSSGFMAVIFGTSVVKALSLSGGGKVVAESMDARLVSTASTTLEEQRLTNVVEEMAIAAGCPVPSVYIVEQPTINAFAAGTSIDDAVIGVTRGAIQQFTRDELQAVVGHEFSHIINGDMKLNIKLIAWCAGLALLAEIGTWMIRSSGRGRNEKSQIGLIGIAVFTIGSLGYLMALFLQKALSRQREYLADASAVQFTRDSQGMTHALARIAERGSIVDSQRSSEIAHMFFADGVKRFAGNLMATHPPLEKRILRIDKNFSFETFRKSNKKISELQEKPVKNKEQIKSPLNIFGKNAAISIPMILTQIGKVSDHSNKLSSKYIQSMKKELKRITKEPYSARLIVLGLMASESKDQNSFYTNTLEKSLDARSAKEFSKILTLLGAYPRDDYLSLVDLCLPSLRELTQNQANQFMETLKLVAFSDRSITFLEFTIYTVVKFSLSKNASFTFEKIQTTLPKVGSITLLIEAVIRSDKNNQEMLSDEEIQSFQDAVAHMPEKYRNLNTTTSWSMKNFEAALETCSKMSTPSRNNLIQALVNVAKGDREVSVGEYEMIRCIAQRLGRPMPLLR